MSEKVLHEWVDGDEVLTRYRIVEKMGHLFTEYLAGGVWRSNANIGTTHECARLASRVAELEGEKVRLAGRLVGMAIHAEHFAEHMDAYVDCPKCVLAQKEIDEVLS